MRKNIFAAVLAAMFLVVVSTRVTASSTESKNGAEYTFGVLQDNSMNAGQMKDLFQMEVELLRKNTGVIIKMEWFHDEEKFLQELKNGRFHFIFAWKVDNYVLAMKKYGYMPLVSYEAFGLGDILCLYTKNNSSIAEIDDMKDKRVSICGVKADYFRLEQVLRKNPEDFLNELKIQKNLTSCSSFFYSLSLGETDVIFVSPFSVEVFKRNNPGPVKNISRIACSKELPRFFVLYSKNVPEKVVSSLRDTMLNSYKAPEMKKYLPLLKTTGFKITYVAPNGYQGWLKMYDEADKKGLQKSYDLLMKMQGN